MGRTYVQIRIEDEENEKKDSCLKALKAKLCPCIKEVPEKMNEVAWRTKDFPNEFLKPPKPEPVDENKKHLMVRLDSNANNVEDL